MQTRLSLRCLTMLYGTNTHVVAHISCTCLYCIVYVVTDGQLIIMPDSMTDKTIGTYIRMHNKFTAYYIFVFNFFFFFTPFLYEPRHSKVCKLACEPIEDSDQTAWIQSSIGALCAVQGPRSLFKVFSRKPDLGFRCCCFIM